MIRSSYLLSLLVLTLSFASTSCKKKTGCTDYTAKNYDPTAEVDDESCLYYRLGCTDRNALNYDALAEFDDGKCQYPEGYVLGSFPSGGNGSEGNSGGSSGGSGGPGGSGGGVNGTWNAGETVYTFTYDGKTYEIIKEMKSYGAATQYTCDQGGSMTLLYIDSQEEQDAVWEEILNANLDMSYTSVSDGGGIAYLWLGGNDLQSEGWWTWRKFSGNCSDLGDNFYQGQGAAGSGGGSVDPGEYANWGGASTGTFNEPDDFGSGQDACAIALADWPYGIAGEWNDISENNSLYFIVEY